MNADPTANKHGGNPESVAAFEFVRPHADALREQIVEYISEQGAHGATCDEVTVALDLRIQTASARITEAKADGEVFKSGLHRPTRSGCNAAVLVTSQEHVTMPTSDVLNKPRGDKPNAGLTIVEQIWQQLDGAYARYRRYRKHPSGTLPGEVNLEFMHGRVVGLVEALATLTFPATVDQVKAECLRRWKSRVDTGAKSAED